MKVKGFLVLVGMLLAFCSTSFGQGYTCTDDVSIEKSITVQEGAVVITFKNYLADPVEIVSGTVTCTKDIKGHDKTVSFPKGNESIIVDAKGERLYTVKFKNALYAGGLDPDDYRVEIKTKVCTK